VKNIDLLNICYKFFNGFITDDVLIEQLSKINKTKLPKKEIEETDILIKSIKKIINDNIEINSYEKWFKITEYISKNPYFTKTFESLTDYELLEFIAQNIQAPFPPNLTQEEFDKLVKVGIEKDEREWLWRLAFNYENSEMNFDNIVNYFIYKNDGYYLTELISAVGECLNIDDIIDRINDIELIDYLIKQKDVISSYVSNKQFNILKKKLDL
jgi:hypothetical protein